MIRKMIRKLIFVSVLAFTLMSIKSYCSPPNNSDQFIVSDKQWGGDGSIALSDKQWGGDGSIALSDKQWGGDGSIALSDKQWGGDGSIV